MKNTKIKKGRIFRLKISKNNFQNYFGDKLKFKLLN